MKSGVYWGIVIVCLVAFVILFVRIFNLSSEVRNMSERNERALAALQDSFKRVQGDIATARQLAPGLGNHMTTIQLHAGKLWFAVKASNWELAEYELDEPKETMESAKGLNVEKNGVKISNLLDAVLQTQVAELDKSTKSKSQAEFQKSYDETLSACNGCHQSTGYSFIDIVRPTGPPVTNQKWAMGSK